MTCVCAESRETGRGVEFDIVIEAFTSAWGPFLITSKQHFCFVSQMKGWASKCMTLVYKDLCWWNPITDELSKYGDLELWVAVRAKATMCSPHWQILSRICFSPALAFSSLPPWAWRAGVCDHLSICQSLQRFSVIPYANPPARGRMLVGSTCKSTPRILSLL